MSTNNSSLLQSSSPSLLVMDWGIGGLSVYREIKNKLPQIPCVYLSDSGFTPYGKMEENQLADRLIFLMNEAKKRWNTQRVILACNAASTTLSILGKRKNEFFPLKVTGMIEAGVQLVLETQTQKVGVIGGIRTIESQMFSSKLNSFGIEVMQQVAQPLSALIEKGVLSGIELEETLLKILSPFRNENQTAVHFKIEALLLACTHYPAVSNEIQKLLPGIKLLDPSKKVADQLADEFHPFFSEKKTSEPEKPFQLTDLFLTTGSTQEMNLSAKKAFHIHCESAPFL